MIGLPIVLIGLPWECHQILRLSRPSAWPTGVVSIWAQDNFLYQILNLHCPDSTFPGLAENGCPQWVYYSACDKAQWQGNQNSFTAILIHGVTGELIGARRCWSLWLRDADFQLKNSWDGRIVDPQLILRNIFSHSVYFNALAVFTAQSLMMWKARILLTFMIFVDNLIWNIKCIYL